MLENIQTLKLTYLDFRTKLQITTRHTLCKGLMKI